MRFILTALDTVGAFIDRLMTHECSICEGTGTAPFCDWPCPVCNGEGRV